MQTQHARTSYSERGINDNSKGDAAGAVVTASMSWSRQAYHRGDLPSGIRGASCSIPTEASLLLAIVRAARIIPLVFVLHGGNLRRATLRCDPGTSRAAANCGMPGLVVSTYLRKSLGPLFRRLQFFVVVSASQFPAVTAAPTRGIIAYSGSATSKFAQVARWS